MVQAFFDGFNRIISGKGVEQQLETKSTSGTKSLDEIILDFGTAYGIGQKMGIGWLSSLGAINFYNTVSPIANAVDLISQECGNIPLSVYDKVEKKFIKDGDMDIKSTPQKVLNLMKKVNYTESYMELMKQQISYFLITGNCFTITQSLNPSSEPLEIFTAKPQNIIIAGTGTSLVGKYIWNDGNRHVTFTWNILQNKFTGTDAKGLYYEITQTKEFNPKANTGNMWGQSKLAPVYNEMEQFISGVVHNKNLLQNGSRPSGVLTLDEEMDDATYEKAKVDMENFYKGASNAGNILIFQGQGSKFEQFGITPKDMDYALLHDKTTRSLYNRLKIPAPLVTDSVMTYNNLDSALYQLYILAVLPAIKMLLDDFNSLLMPRFKDGDRYCLRIDENEIPVMRARQREDDEKMIKLGFNTYNEARSKYGYDDLSEGGDVVFVPSSVVPILQAVEKPQTNPAEGQPMNLPEEKSFRNILERQGFSPDAINDAVVKIYGKR